MIHIVMLTLLDRVGAPRDDEGQCPPTGLGGQAAFDPCRTPGAAINPDFPRRTIS
jgi:hypothetical protein